MAEKRILAIEYACEPYKGSEPGVGWNWTKIVSETPGYHITVVTRANNKPVIDEYKKAHPECKVDFEYYDLPAWLLKHKHGEKNIQFFFTFWQRGVIKFIKKNINLDDFDIVWDFNFGSLNLPAFTYKLKKRYIVGPVSTKKKILESYIRETGLWSKIKYLFIQFCKEHLWLNPFVWKTLKRAENIILCNEIYREYLPNQKQEEAEIVFHNGILETDIIKNHTFVDRESDKLRLIFAGRLIDSKNLETAIKALRIVKDNGIDFTYKIVGNGPLGEKLRKLVEKLELQDEVVFVDSVKQEDLFREYLDNDYFLFPSLLEISSTSVMEAIYCGLKPICLDIMGMDYVLGDAPVYKMPTISPEADKEQMAKCMIDIAKNRVRTEKNVLHTYAKEHFLWSVREKDIQRILHSTID